MKLILAYFMALTLLLSIGCGQKQETLDNQLETKPEPVQEVEPVVMPEPEIDSAALKEEQFQRDASMALQNIFFAYDSYALNEEAREILAGIGQFLQQYDDVSLKVEGHCDERGSTEYNMALGQKRADEARKYLITYGIGGSKISTVSWGEERPAEMGSDEESWSRNRRDEFSYERY